VKNYASQAKRRSSEAAPSACPTLPAAQMSSGACRTRSFGTYAAAASACVLQAERLCCSAVP
jgi:hypothetical protein